MKTKDLYKLLKKEDLTFLVSKLNSSYEDEVPDLGNVARVSSGLVDEDFLDENYTREKLESRILMDKYIQEFWTIKSLFNLKVERDFRRVWRPFVNLKKLKKESFKEFLQYLQGREQIF